MHAAVHDGVRARERRALIEAKAHALLILFGGIEIAESMILNVVWALLSHPDQLARIRGNPDRLAAVEESLRWEPAVQTLTRRVTRAR